MTYNEKGKGKDPKKGEEGLRKGERYLIKDFNGLVKGGEMMLVVGRPGAGCTTFLKALAGLNNGYAGVDGVVRYGNMTEGKGLKPFRSDVIFNSEEGEFRVFILDTHSLQGPFPLIRFYLASRAKKTAI